MVQNLEASLWKVSIFGLSWIVLIEIILTRVLLGSLFTPLFWFRIEIHYKFDGHRNNLSLSRLKQKKTYRLNEHRKTKILYLMFSYN